MKRYKVSYLIESGGKVQEQEVSAEKVGIVENGQHLVFVTDEVYVAAFADGYWIRFVEVVDADAEEEAIDDVGEEVGEKLQSTDRPMTDEEVAELSPGEE